MARFLLIITGDPDAWEGMTSEEEDRVVRGHRDFLAAAGSAVLDGGELAPAREGTRLRSRGGDEPEVEVGPPAPGAHVVGGWYLVEAPDEQEAVRLAGLLPEVRAACASGVEVRRLLDG